MGSGVLVFGDIRDVGESVVQRDALGTGLNLAGFIPLFGDGEKVGKNSVKVVIKYPAKAVELFKGLVKSGTLDVVPEAHLPGIIDTYLKGTTEKFIKNGVTGKDLLYITKKGKLEETLGVIKRSDGAVVWLEEGKIVSGKTNPWVEDKCGSGWEHIMHNHVLKPNDNHFAKKFGSVYEDPIKVKELISNGVKYGQYIPEKKVYEYIEPVSGNKLHVAVGSNGYIVSAFPAR